MQHADYYGMGRATTHADTNDDENNNIYIIMLIEFWSLF